MGNRRKRKKQPNPIFAGVLFVTVVLIIAGVSIVVEKFKPSEEAADLYKYYGVAANSDEVAVYLNQEQSGVQAKYFEDELYVKLAFLQEIDQKFYWDVNEEILIYTTPTEVIKANEGEGAFMSTSKTEPGYVIVRNEEDCVYVNIKFAELYTNMSHTEYTGGDGPARVQIWTEKHDLTVADGKNNPVVRTGESIKADVVEELANGAKFTILSENGEWSYVLTENGHRGYIRTKEIGAKEIIADAGTYKTPNYTNITSDEKICMVWHQVTNQTANERLLSMMSGTKGINVISPTWFSLSDAKGNFTSLASETYVNDAHNVLGCQVWALIDDFARDSDGKSYVSQVLPYTSKRENLINQLMISARTYGFDGINVDFELITQAISQDYMQFLRELSAECRKAGIVLSIDNYVPMPYNKYYGRAEQGVLADYVIVMGYDEHMAGSETAGSVASLSFVENGITGTLEEVPAEKVINAVPFYTRIWTETSEQYAQDGDTIVEDAINGNYAIGSEAVPMGTALDKVSENGAEKIWLEDVGQYYAEYTSGNSTVRIWLEEEKSMEEKMKLVSEYELAGVAGWKLGLEDSSIWDVIGKYLK